MFDLEAEFVIELWDLLKHHASSREKDDVCLQMLQIFDAHGLSLEDLSDLKEDKDINSALLTLYGEEEEEDEDEDDEEYGDNY